MADYPHRPSKFLFSRTKGIEYSEVYDDLAKNIQRLKNLLPRVQASLKKRTKRSESPVFTKVSDLFRKAQRAAQAKEDDRISEELKILGTQQDDLLEELGFYFKDHGLHPVSQEEVAEVRQILLGLKGKVKQAVENHAENRENTTI
jgi:hypothetical protein